MCWGSCLPCSEPHLQAARTAALEAERLATQARAAEAILHHDPVHQHHIAPSGIILMVPKVTNGHPKGDRSESFLYKIMYALYFLFWSPANT